MHFSFTTSWKESNACHLVCNPENPETHGLKLFLPPRGPPFFFVGSSTSISWFKRCAPLSDKTDEVKWPAHQSLVANQQVELKASVTAAGFNHDFALLPRQETDSCQSPKRASIQGPTRTTDYLAHLKGLLAIGCHIHTALHSQKLNIYFQLWDIELFFFAPTHINIINMIPHPSYNTELFISYLSVEAMILEDTKVQESPLAHKQRNSSWWHLGGHTGKGNE